MKSRFQLVFLIAVILSSSLFAQTSIELSTINGTNGVLFKGIDAFDMAGTGLASGDINGDGIDDAIIGASQGDSDDFNSGEIYVVFGKSSAFTSPFSLSSLNGTNGFTIFGVSRDDQAGRNISTGDINGDGIDDIIISAPFANTTVSDAGKVYVVFGKNTGFSSTLSLSTLNGTNGFTINGIGENHEIGYSGLDAGDINGDNIDDVLIGSWFIGTTYVLYGKTSAFSAAIDLSSLDGTNGFSITNSSFASNLGISISSGDINNDGIEDLVMGASGVHVNTTWYAGATYVLFGKTAAFSSTISVSSLDGSNGFTLNGAAANDRSGSRVSSGDINGDSISDVIIGASSADPNGVNNAGKVYIFYGKSSSFSTTVDLSTLDGTNGFVVNGINASDNISLDQLRSEDMNNDSIDDLVISASLADPNGNGSGQTYIVFGKRSAFSTSMNLSDLNGDNGYALNGIRAEHASSRQLATGDINGDGTNDVLIWAQDIRLGSADDRKGEVYLYFGSPFYSGGEGTVSSPYLIENAKQLNAVRENLNASFKLIKSIDLSQATGASTGKYWNDGKGWEPIGDSLGPFTGRFIGDGHKISGLYINRSTEDYIGLFGVLSTSAWIEALGLSNVNLVGNDFVGALAGRAKHSIASTSTSINSVRRIFSSGTVSGNNYVGGLIGYASNTTLFFNYSTAMVAGNIMVGGLLGKTETHNLRLVYSSGAVTGNSLTGGLIGAYTNFLELFNYWNTETSGQTNGIGNGTDSEVYGLTSAQMKQLSSFSAFAGTGEWQIDEGNSFPFLTHVRPFVLPGNTPESIVGGSLAFNNGGLTIPENDAFDNLKAFTIETWIQLNSTVRQGILEKHAAASSGWHFEFSSAHNALLISIVTASGSRFTTSTINPSLNNWHHVAATYDGTSLKLFLDGEDVTGTNSGTGNGAITNNTRDVLIGDLNWTTGKFDGKMDEIRMWNTTRSQAQIRRNMFQRLRGFEPGLILYLPLNESSGNVVLDKSFTNNQGSLSAGTTWDTATHPYGTFITGDEGWRILTTPVASTSYGSLLDPIWTQGFTGADAPNGTSNVYAWNEATRSFTAISNAADIPNAGQGILTYVYDDDDNDGSPDGFPKVLKVEATQRSGTVTPVLSFTDNSDVANDGWNLIGNPYGATINWDLASGRVGSNIDASFYVWSDSSGAYLSWNGSTGTFGSGEIAPWQGFWVKANAPSPALSFKNAARSGGGILRKQALVSQLGFTLKGEALSSKTILMFSDQSSTEKDALDAYKLQSLSGGYLSLFTQLEDGSGLDINALPFDLEGEVSIPLGFDGSNLNGAFELSWNPQALPEGMAIVLIDNDTGTEIDLTEASSYSFELEAKAKAVQTQHIASPQQGIKVPSHLVFSPKVMKAKTSGTRFTIKINAATSVSSELDSDLPSVVELDQNYPNPFNPSTTINFAVPEQSNVQLVIYDMLGRKVAELLNEPKTPGRYSINFDASQLASGLYLYQLQLGSSVLTKKMTLIK